MPFPELSAFARHLERTSPDDRDEHVLNSDRAREISMFLQQNGSAEHASCIEAASKLIDVLAATSSSVSRHEVLALACQVLRAAERGILHQESLEALAQADMLQRAEPLDTPRAKGPSAAGSAPIAREAQPAQRPSKGIHPDLSGINNMVFGKLLMELKQATREQVAAALKMHREKGLPIGECLLVNGVAPEDLLETLKLQRKLRSGSVDETAAQVSESGDMLRAEQAAMRFSQTRPGPKAGSPRAAGKHGADAMLLGEVLLHAKLINQDQLEQAISLHGSEGISLGQALRQAKAISKEELIAGLELQRRLRAAIGLVA